MFSFHTRVVAPVPQVCLFTGAPPLLDRVWGPHSTVQIGRQSLSACGCPPERPLGKTGVGDGPAQVAVGRAQGPDQAWGSCPWGATSCPLNLTWIGMLVWGWDHRNPSRFPGKETWDFSLLAGSPLAGQQWLSGEGRQTQVWDSILGPHCPSAAGAPEISWTWVGACIRAEKASVPKGLGMDSGAQGTRAWSSRWRSQRPGSLSRDLRAPGEDTVPPVHTCPPGREGRKTTGRPWMACLYNRKGQTSR